MSLYGKQRFKLIIEPVSGKAVPVYMGEVLRITLIEGAQCVDFNCFNLHDYKERMSVGHSRLQGFRLRKGNVLMSIPNRYNPMMAILEMPETCVTDLLGARCWAQLFEMTYGFDTHTNCQQTFAETIGEYGLTPDDVHDSFNMWMNTGWDDLGAYFPSTRRNSGRKGDYVDLLALMDVLAVPITCGSGDVMPVSNYCFKPIQIQIFEASDESKKLAENYLHLYKMKRQTVQDFHIKDIRTERELKPIPGYKPNFINFPLKIQEVEVELTDKDYDQVQRLKMRHLGEDDEDAIRASVMEWCHKNRTSPLFALQPWKF
jgi:uncharacterized protein YcgI (DUF1989 family)